MQEPEKPTAETSAKPKLTATPKQQYEEQKKRYLKRLEQTLAAKDFNEGLKLCANLSRQFPGDLEKYYRADLLFHEEIAAFRKKFEALQQEDAQILH